MQIYRALACIIVFSTVVTAPSYAQIAVEPVAGTIATPQFLVSLIAGVLLAIGFQVLLTALSVAIGVSAVGNIEKNAHKSHKSKNDHHSSSDKTPMGVKISSGLGIWTLLTVTIALFCASLLAVKLSLVGNTIIGVTLGLVIWAAFFTTMAYLEIKSVSSLLGSLISTAVSGIKSSASAVQDLFKGSPYGKIEDIAENTIHKVREELQDSIDTRGIEHKIDEHLTRIEQSGPNYDQIKQDFVNILKDLQIEERSNTEVGGDVHTDIFMKLASEQSNLSKKDVKKLSGVFNQAREAVKSGDTNEDKAKKLATQFSSASEQDIDRYVTQIEDYLRSTGREEVSPDSIRADIEKISQDPKHTGSILSDRVSKMDRSTFVALLEQNKNMDHAKAEKVAGYVEQALDFVKSKTSSAQSQTKSASNRTNQMQGEGKEQASAYQAKFEGAMKNYFDRMERPELSYDSLKWDLEKMLHDPKSSPSVLKNRFSQFDRETLIALLTNNEKLSRNDVERIATQIENTKTNILAKAEQVEEETKRRIEQVKEEALHQAENTRKTAASAAWWLFATAVVSGIAAAAGGWIAII